METEELAQQRLLEADLAGKCEPSWFVCVHEGCPDPAVVSSQAVYAVVGGASLLRQRAMQCEACGFSLWEVPRGWLEARRVQQAQGELMGKLGQVCETIQPGVTHQVEPEEIPARAVSLAAWAVRRIAELSERAEEVVVSAQVVDDEALEGAINGAELIVGRLDVREGVDDSQMRRTMDCVQELARAVAVVGEQLQART